MLVVRWQWGCVIPTSMLKWLRGIRPSIGVLKHNMHFITPISQVVEDKPTEKELWIVLHGGMCGQGGGIDHKHTLQHNIRHPPNRQLVANQIFVSVFKPFGGIAFLALMKVATRVTDGSWNLDVLLAYTLGIKAKFGILCKRSTKVFPHNLFSLSSCFTFFL